MQNRFEFEKFITYMKKRLVYNMMQVCESFHRGGLFYSSDEAVEAREKELDSKTSLTSMEQMILSKMDDEYHQTIFLISNTYRLKKDHSASHALSELLFSNTSAECNGAIQLAYYLTLLDAFIFFYDKNGKNKFDEVFANDGDNCGFNFGRMGNCFSGDESDPMSPQHYFMKYDKDINLQQVMSAPEEYIGCRFRIRNHDDYLKKHPHGSAQGWNIVFVGLKNNEPMFMGATQKNAIYTMTLNEFKKLCVSEYNLPPTAFAKSPTYKTLININDVKFLNGSIGFNYEKLYEELSDIKQLKKNISNFYKIYSTIKIPPMSSEAAAPIYSRFFMHPKEVVAARKEQNFTDDMQLSKYSRTTKTW